jgi:membrane protease YdiL (CAAX protease family)
VSGAAERAGLRLARGRVEVATLGLVVTGIALLLARIWLPALGAQGRVVALAATMVAILVGSLLVPVGPGRAMLRPSLVLLAAVAEEALFRRAAYSALERHGAALAVGVTAVAFALIHVPLYGWAVLPVDLGAGLLLSWQRWASGTWTVPAATHAAANFVMTVLR